MPRPLHHVRTTVAKSARVAHVVEFLFRRSDASEDIYPDDDDHGTVNGPDRERVIFLGEPGEISLGVRTHELSLPAFFSRHRTTATHRGVSWSIAPLPNSRLDEAPPLAASMASELEKTDIVVVMVGICDALRVIRPRVWERHLRDTLDVLVQHLPPTAHIVIADIPPLDNAGSLSRAARVAAGAHGRLLNRHTRTVAAEYAGVEVMTFPSELTESVWRPEGVEQRYSYTYRVWGRHLADAAPVDRPAASFTPPDAATKSDAGRQAPTSAPRTSASVDADARQ